jgi:hypothetical protein
MLTKLMSLLTHKNHVHTVPSRVGTTDSAEAYHRDKQVALLKSKTLRMFPG